MFHLPHHIDPHLLNMPKRPTTVRCYFSHTLRSTNIIFLRCQGQMRLSRDSPWLTYGIEAKRKARRTRKSDEEYDGDVESAIGDRDARTKVATKDRRSSRDADTLGLGLSDCGTNGSDEDAAVVPCQQEMWRLRDGVESSSSSTTTSRSEGSSSSCRTRTSSATTNDSTTSSVLTLNDPASFKALCPLITCGLFMSGSSKEDVRAHFDKHHAAHRWNLAPRTALVLFPLRDKTVQKRSRYGPLATWYLQKKAKALHHCPTCGKGMVRELNLRKHAKKCRARDH